MEPYRRKINFSETFHLPIRIAFLNYLSQKGSNLAIMYIGVGFSKVLIILNMIYVFDMFSTAVDVLSKEPFAKRRRITFVVLLNYQSMLRR